MKIRYTRSGGIAPIKTRVEVNASDLPKEKAETIRKLLSAKKPRKKPPTRSDDFTHELQVDDGQKQYVVCRNDSDCTREQIELFDYLQNKALTSPQRGK